MKASLNYICEKHNNVLICCYWFLECGSTINLESGTLSFPSENTSWSYNVARDCQWVIHVSPDKVINVTFTRLISQYTPDCRTEYLQVSINTYVHNNMAGF